MPARFNFSKNSVNAMGGGRKPSNKIKWRFCFSKLLRIVVIARSTREMLAMALTGGGVTSALQN